MKSKLGPLILAGGVDKRLRSLSTESNLKQFTPIFKNLSLLEPAMKRINNRRFIKPIVAKSEKFTLEAGDSIINKKSQVHSLENDESYPLEVEEIQTGDYFQEDDLVLIDDIYGRADLH